MPQRAYLNGPIGAGSQHGVVLIVSLIILLVMTVIGTSSMNSVTLEERMVSNAYDDNLSFQAAEAGLNDCEARLVTRAFSPKDKGSFWQAGYAAGNYGGSIDWYDDATLWDTSVDEVQAYAEGASGFTALSTGAGKLAADPLCFYEHLDDVKWGGKGWEGVEQKLEVWNTNVRGVGASSNAVSVLQSTVYVRY